MSRTFALGDIHGCLGKLEDLISKIRPEKDDIFIFLGDYIDRGYNPKEVIDFLIGFATEVPCIFLRGNHEDMFLEFLEFGTNKTIFFANGGLKTIDSYIRPKPFTSHAKVAYCLPEDHRDFYASLKWYHEDNDYIYAHAGVKPDIPIHLQDRRDLIWIRDEFIFSSTGLKKKVIFGHTPFARPLSKPDKIGIDTGAVYGGTLTAVQLPQETFFHSYR
jgi:serine/threonine protein phosphatase 1